MINPRLYNTMVATPAGQAFLRSGMALHTPNHRPFHNDATLHGALQAVIAGGETVARTQFQPLFAQAQRFSPTSQGLTGLPATSRPHSRYFAVPHQIGVTRLFSMPMGRENETFINRLAVIFPNWSRLEFETLSRGENGRASIEIRNPKIVNSSGKPIGDVSAAPNPHTPSQILFSEGTQVFLVCTLVEEIRRGDLTDAPRGVLIHPASLLRLNDHPVFSNPLELQDASISLLGSGAMTKGPHQGGLRHAVSFLFSDGVIFSVRFLTKHHSGSDLDQVQGTIFVPTESGEKKIDATVKVRWSRSEQGGEILLEGPDRILEIPLGYPQTGRGEIRLGVPQAERIDPSWRLLIYPPQLSSPWYESLTAAPETVPDSSPLPQRDPLGLALTLNKGLLAGNIEKIHGDPRFSAKALYTGGKGSPWRVEAKFGKGLKGNKVVEATFQFPGDKGTFKLVEVEGGTLLFPAGESRYAESAFFIGETRRELLLEVTPAEIRRKVAGSESPDFKEVKAEKLEQHFQINVAPLLAEYRDAALNGVKEKPEVKRTAPQAALRDQFFVRLDQDPEMALVASFDGRPKTPKTTRPYDYDCEEHGIHQQRLSIYRIGGMELQIYEDLTVPENVPYGYYRVGEKFHQVVAVPFLDGLYLYLMGNYFGVVFLMDEKTREVREVTSTLVRHRLFGETPSPTWLVTPKVVERGLEMLLRQREIDTIFRTRRGGVNEDVDRFPGDAEHGDQKSFRRGKWQAQGSGPSVAWVELLPEAMHTHLGIDIATHDFHDLLGEELGRLLKLKGLHNYLMNLSDEAAEDVESGLDLFSRVISRAMARLLVGDQAHFLEGRLRLLREQERETREAALAPLAMRLGKYLRQMLLESLSDFLPTLWKEEMMTRQFLDRLEIPDSLLAQSER